MSQKNDDKTTLRRLALEAVARSQCPIIGSENWAVVQAINYVLGEHYRRKVVNFDDPGLWLDRYVKGQLRVTATVIRNLLGDELSEEALTRLERLEHLARPAQLERSSS